MKTYAYKRTDRPGKYGNNVTLEIYRVEGEQLTQITKERFQERAWRGLESELARALIDAGELPEAILDSHGYFPPRRQKEFEITFTALP